MLNDNIEQTELEGVYIIKRPVLNDDRGFFREVFRKADLETRLGFAFEPVQMSQSRSRLGTLRGIHIAPWHKLITVTGGSAQQVVVDTRISSSTFGKYISLEIGQNNWCSVFIPAGCGNSFLSTSETTDYVYSVSDYWTPGKEQSVIYNDPDLDIPWMNPTPDLSAKDMQNQSLRQLFPDKFK